MLSQHKNMIGLFWECWQQVNIRDTCDNLQECFISLSENRKANQSVGIVSHRSWCSWDSPNRLRKELNLWSVLSGKGFHLERERDSIFGAKHQVNNIVEEQFRN